jgi:ribosomal protein S13
MLDRFEIKNHVSNKSMLISDIETKFNLSIIDSLNLTFSQVNSVNNSIEELKKFNILRLYLIKSHRGKCHALGKPVRGQRT